jgi:hypothetical protein
MADGRHASQDGKVHSVVSRPELKLNLRPHVSLLFYLLLLLVREPLSVSHISEATLCHTPLRRVLDDAALEYVSTLSDADELHLCQVPREDSASETRHVSPKLRNMPQFVEQVDVYLGLGAVLLKH